MDYEKIAIAVTSGLIGGLVVIFTNWWRTRYTVKAQDFSKRVEEVLKKIESLEEMSCSYWSSTNKENKEITEAKILGRQGQVGMLINHLAKEYKIHPLNKIEEKYLDLCDACTGAEFNSAGLEKAKIPAYIQKVLDHSEKLKIELFESRTKKY
ncbi:hypothetical protein [Pantoea ananatis]|uniref:hypothetical protein n=1 Tax=Pantoea ananas TaxID=553 RepID=UPI000E271CC3|nr:hypothetical protein [Pantoea ananatis]REC88719.1 hypothetical protein C7423_1267 [Pantoea ananatis]